MTRIFKPSTLLPFFLFVVTAVGSVYLQSENIARWRKIPFRYRETLYLPSSQYVKAVSVGYDQFVADFLWLRMIQSYAAAYSSPDNAERMNKYFQTITDLDPRFVDVYRFAMLGIGEQGLENADNAKKFPEYAAQYPKGVDPFKQVVDFVKGVTTKGIYKDYATWQIPYDGAFFAFWTLNDPALAKFNVRMAKLDPDHPDYIDRWEGFFDIKQGRYQAAYEKYLNDFLDAAKAHNKDLYGILRTNLNRAINQWIIDTIKQKALQWQKDHGALPTLEQLDQAGAFAGVEIPDAIMINQIIQGLIDGTQAAKFSDAEKTQFIQKAIRRWEHLPPGPDDELYPQFKGYVIWPGQPTESEHFVMSTLEAMIVLKKVTADVNQVIKTYKQKKGTYPADLAAFAPDLLKDVDPWGKRWIYDTAKHVVYPESFPNILEMTLPDE
jgi:hypothetical protein